MSPDTSTWRAFRPVVLRRGAAVAATLSLSFGVGGCAIGNAIKAVHNLANAAHNLKNLESQIQKGENAKYEATYKSTGGGSTSSTITIAQEPGGKWTYTTPASGGSGATAWVANGKDTYDCTQASSGGKWSCEESAESTGSDAIDASPAFAFTGADYAVIVESLSAVAALAVLSMGESWHNLHHAYPTSARHGVLRGQLDSSARIIWLMEKFGWATKVRWPAAAKVSALTVPAAPDSIAA